MGFLGKGEQFNKLGGTLQQAIRGVFACAYKGNLLNLDRELFVFLD